MAATPEGNKKSHETLRKKLGEVAYRAHMASIGAKGGKAYVKKGFAVSNKQFRTGSFERSTRYDREVENETTVNE